MADSEQITTNEQFQQWREDKSELIAAGAATAAKDPSDRSEAETEQYDVYVDEIRRVIPGSDQLSAEQIRSLAINLDLGNTQFNGGQVRSLGDATSFVGEQQQKAGQPAQGLPPVSDANLGELSPTPVGAGAGRNSEIEH